MVISEASVATITWYNSRNIVSPNISIFNAMFGVKAHRKYIYAMEVGGFT